MGELAWNLELDVHLTRHESAVLSFEVLSTDKEISLLGDDQRLRLRRGGTDEQRTTASPMGRILCGVGNLSIVPP